MTFKLCSWDPCDSLELGSVLLNEKIGQGRQTLQSLCHYAFSSTLHSSSRRALPLSCGAFKRNPTHKNVASEAKPITSSYIEVSNEICLLQFWHVGLVLKAQVQGQQTFFSSIWGEWGKYTTGSFRSSHMHSDFCLDKQMNPLPKWAKKEKMKCFTILETLEGESKSWNVFVAGH